MSASNLIVRPLRPTDLPALASLWARGRSSSAGGAAAFGNEARVWERLGLDERGLLLLERAVRQWAPIGGRRLTWVALRGLAVRGLASARRRGGRGVWEVDHLVVAPREEGIAASLLEQLAVGLGQASAEKVFLRLGAASSLLDAACSAGFFPYLREQLWRLEEAPQGADSPPLPMRLRTSADLLPLFQLYNASVPVAVRCNEALTLREWAAVQEGGRGQELVLERDGRVAAWLRLGWQDGAGRFALLVARRQDSLLGDLVATALHHLRDRRPIFCPVPEYQGALAARLADCGFQPVAGYAVLANRLTRRVEEEARAPASAHQPYAVR